MTRQTCHWRCRPALRSSDRPPGFNLLKFAPSGLHVCNALMGCEPTTRYWFILR